MYNVIIRLPAFTLVAFLLGCAVLSSVQDTADKLLVLRITWQIPAEQAGVREEMQEHVDRLDAALRTGNPVLVRSTLLSLGPIYNEVRSQIVSPTPEQVEFDELALDLWDDLHNNNLRCEALFEVGRVLLLLLT